MPKVTVEWADLQFRAREDLGPNLGISFFLGSQ
jgi:hypothetical protein